MARAESKSYYKCYCKKKVLGFQNEAKVLLTSSPFLHITKGIVAKLIWNSLQRLLFQIQNQKATISILIFLISSSQFLLFSWLLPACKILHNFTSLKKESLKHDDNMTTKISNRQKKQGISLSIVFCVLTNPHIYRFPLKRNMQRNVYQAMTFLLWPFLRFLQNLGHFKMTF